MATKKTNIEELKQQCLEAENNFKLLREQLEAAKKEEEEAKKAKHEAEKQKRYDAVIDAYENFLELKNKYVEDYGYFAFGTTSGKDGTRRWILNPSVWF